MPDYPPFTQITQRWPDGKVATQVTHYTSFESLVVRDADGHEYMLIAGRIIPRGGSIEIAAVPE
jgi:hypothetical protein